MEQERSEGSLGTRFGCSAVSRRFAGAERLGGSWAT